MVKMIKKAIDGLVDLLTDLAHLIFMVPSPKIGSSGGGYFEPSSTLGSVWASLSWVVMAVGVISMLIAIMRMIWTLQASEGRVIIRMMFNLVASTTVVVGITALAIKAGDEFSPWVLEAISGRREENLVGEKFAHQLLGSTVNGGGALPGMGLVALVLIVIAEIAVVMQIIFMIVRAPLIIAMVAFIPLFAASSGTPKGQERFSKSLGFLLAFVMYKPVAAILYGIGLRMMRATGDEGEPLMQFLWGTTLFVLITLALPAMVKFFVGEAAVGSSNAFSGAAGIAAAGAAVYGAAQLAGALSTGGASAAAAGAGAGAKPSPPPSPDGGGGGDRDRGGGPPPPPPPQDDNTPSAGGVAAPAAGAPGAGDGGAPGVDGAPGAGDGGAPGVDGAPGAGDEAAAAGAAGAAGDDGPGAPGAPTGAESEGGSAYDGGPARAESAGAAAPAGPADAQDDVGPGGAARAAQAGDQPAAAPASAAAGQDDAGPGGAAAGHAGDRHVEPPHGAPVEDSGPPRHTREGAPLAGSRAKSAADRAYYLGRGGGRGAVLVGAATSDMSQSVDRQDAGGAR